MTLVTARVTTAQIQLFSTFNMDDSIISQAVNDLQIPPQPKLLDRIDILLRQDEPDINRVADLITKDVAISASVLKIINSPLYNLKQTVVSIRQATLYIGLDGLVTLVKGMLLKQAFLQSHCSLSLGRFWDTAEEVARAAININKELRLSLPNDYLYALGLFHDAGIPVFASTFSDYKQTLMDANSSSFESILDIENRRYGTNHANIGYLMGHSWNLPEVICEIIAKHHDQGFWRDQSDSELAKLNSVFQLAEFSVHKSRRGFDSLDWLVAKDYVLPTLDIASDELEEFRTFIIEQGV